MKFRTELMTGLCTLLNAGTAYGFEVLDVAFGGRIHERTAGLMSVKKEKKKEKEKERRLQLYLHTSTLCTLFIV